MKVRDVKAGALRRLRLRHRRRPNSGKLSMFTGDGRLIGQWDCYDFRLQKTDTLARSRKRPAPSLSFAMTIPIHRSPT